MLTRPARHTESAAVHPADPRAARTTRRVRARGRRVSLRVAVAAIGLVAVAPATAFGHVVATPSSTAAGSSSVITLTVGHGCDGSATTAIAVQVPVEITTVTPQVKAGWDIEKVMVPLDPAVDDGHGGLRTERVAEVVYTASTPLPDGYRDTFAMQLTLPDDVGHELVLPTVQTCEDGETAWVDVADADGAEPEHPAPTVTTTAAPDDER